MDLTKLASDLSKKKIQVTVPQIQQNQGFIPFTRNAKFEVIRALQQLGFKPWKLNPKLLTLRSEYPLQVDNSVVHVLAETAVPWDTVMKDLPGELSFKDNPLGILNVDPKNVTPKIKTLLKKHNLAYASGSVQYRLQDVQPGAIVKTVAPTPTVTPVEIPQELRKYELSAEAIDRLSKCSEHTTKTVLIMTMKMIWREFNKQKFGSQLREPAFGLMRNTGSRMRVRAYWAPSKRLINVNPQLFNADADTFLEIFLHEICHQATSEISKDYSRELQGHGPTWQAWMRKVGLNPNRYDHRSNSEYADEQTKKILQYYEANRLNPGYLYPGMQCGIFICDKSAFRECVITAIRSDGTSTIYEFYGSDKKVMLQKVRRGQIPSFVYLPKYRWKPANVEVTEYATAKMRLRS